MADIDIVNGAMIHLGLQPLTTLDDPTDRAIAAKTLYTSTRDALLRMHPWNFAVRRISLAQLSTPPVSDFDFQFQLPADCLRVLKIDDAHRDFKIEGGLLLTNESPCIIQYITRVTDTNQFDVLFTEALEHLLASHFAQSLRNSPEIGRELAAEFQEFLRQARLANAHEGVMANVWDDDIVRYRRRNIASPLIPWDQGGL